MVFCNYDEEQCCKVASGPDAPLMCILIGTPCGCLIEGDTCNVDDPSIYNGGCCASVKRDPVNDPAASKFRSHLVDSFDCDFHSQLLPSFLEPVEELKFKCVADDAGSATCKYEAIEETLPVE